MNSNVSVGIFVLDMILNSTDKFWSESVMKVGKARITLKFISHISHCWTGVLLEGLDGVSYKGGSHWTFLKSVSCSDAYLYIPVKKIHEICIPEKHRFDGYGFIVGSYLTGVQHDGVSPDRVLPKNLPTRRGPT